MSGDGQAAEAVERARTYYDSLDADEFYYRVWGGEDIHIGLYDGVCQPAIREASRRTVARMANRLSHLARGAQVLDIGSGYGGSARYLTRERGLPTTCLNLSSVQNRRNRAINDGLGLGDAIAVVDGNFEELPFGEAAFDAVWSQDAILHSSRREQVFAEVNRVLKPGGDFVFTDPMQAEDAPPGTLGPVLARIHLASLGAIPTYRNLAAALEWTTLDIDDLSPNLPLHYASVKAELESRSDELAKFCSGDYRKRMLAGLDHWVDAGRTGALVWGILHFRKQGC